MRVLIVATCLVASLHAHASGRIELWVRSAGTYGGAATPQFVGTAVDLADLTPTEIEADDLQFRSREKFRGVPIQELWENFAVPLECDGAVLHFRNGMAVTYPFRDRAVVARLGLFVATAIWEASAESGNWSSSFPTASRGATDSHPVFFEGNKVVSKTRWHPSVRTKAADEFSPWEYIDNLTGVEFVRMSAYWDQFRVGDATATKGLELFRERCNFCHGVRGVGARYGWDYVTPLPVYQQRDPDSLLLHLKYRPLDGSTRGPKMPVFKDATLSEARALHAWMRAVSEHALREYLPIDFSRSALRLAPTGPSTRQRTN